jgi:hypothetical protein
VILLDARDLDARHHLLVDDSDALSIDVRGLSPGSLALALPAIEALLAHFPSARVRVDGEHRRARELLEAQLAALGRRPGEEIDLRIGFHHGRDVRRSFVRGVRTISIPRRRDERLTIAEGFVDGVRALGVRVTDAPPRFRFLAAARDGALVDLPRDPASAAAISGWLERRGFRVANDPHALDFARVVTATPSSSALACATRARVITLHLRDDPRNAPPGAIALDFRAHNARTLDELPPQVLRRWLEPEL